MPDPGPAPLLLTPTLLPKVWGGRQLAQLGKALPNGVSIGESWELADLGATSSSGAGGQAVRSVIASGPLAGRTLHEAVKLWDRALLGDLALTSTGEFPILLKFLDASQNLSVQVHPSPAFAAAHAKGTAGTGTSTAHLKTESWYIVDAAPDAMLYIGLAEGVSRDEFAEACRRGGGGASGSRDERLESMLRRVPAVVGECHTLPSGTLHALGAGVVVAEVQTPSDTTFRLYDWGRAGRELHVEHALASMADPSIAAPTRSALANGELCGRLATTPYYTIDEARPHAGDELTIGYACKASRSAPFVLMVLDGAGELASANGEFGPLSCIRGNTILIPAAVARHTVLRAGEALRVLRVGLCG